MGLTGKEIIKVGPWPGGLNLRDQDKGREVVDRRQLRWCKNLDVLDSGVLQSRLGCRKILASAPIYSGTSIQLVGSIIEGADKSTYAVVGSFNAGNTTFYYTKAPNIPTFTAITTAQTGKFTDLVTYNGVFYFIQNVGGTGTAQSRTTVIGAGAWTAQPNIPKANQAFVIRDRMFVIDWNANTVYWSKATDPTVWAAPDGGSFIVSPSDGQVITKVVFINNSIYIFKRNQTYLFTFNSDPGIDGQLTPLSTVRGAHDAIVYNNEIYLVNDQSVYKLVNNYFTDLGILSNFYSAVGPDQLDDPLIRLFIEAGDKLVVGPINKVNPSLFFSHYVMNLKTGAWSQRLYSDAIVQPQSDAQKKSLSWIDSNTAAGACVGNIYISGGISGTNVLSYTKFKAYDTQDIRQNTLDINSAEHTISPEYSFTTSEIVDGSYPEWKRCFFVTYRGELDWDDFTDTRVSFEVRYGPDIYTVAQTQTIPVSPNFFTIEREGKLPFSSFRFKSAVIGMIKASDDLGTIGAKNPNDNNLILISSIQLLVSANRQQISEAVNA